MPSGQPSPSPGWRSGVLAGVLAFWLRSGWRSGLRSGALRSALRSGVLAFWRSGVLENTRSGLRSRVLLAFLRSRVLAFWRSREHSVLPRNARSREPCMQGHARTGAVLLGMGWRLTKLEGRHVFIGRLGSGRWTRIRFWEDGVLVDIPSCQGRITTRMGPCVPALPTENARPEAVDCAWLYPS